MTGRDPGPRYTDGIRRQVVEVCGITAAALDRITRPIPADKVLVDPTAVLTELREQVLADMCRGERA